METHHCAPTNRCPEVPGVILRPSMAGNRHPATVNLGLYALALKPELLQRLRDSRAHHLIRHWECAEEGFAGQGRISLTHVSGPAARALDVSVERVSRGRDHRDHHVRAG